MKAGVTKDQLKPCPFCGGEADINRCGNRWQAWCRHCATIQMGEFYDTEADAIVAWNRRADKDISQRRRNTMRLIDADRLKAEIMGWCVVTDDLFGMGKQHEREIVLQAIEESPTIDAVPVVRCRECMYRQKAKVNRKGFLICPASGMEITDDDFCSYGERKEVGK